jgi:hypothetical protein
MAQGGLSGRNNGSIIQSAGGIQRYATRQTHRPESREVENQAPQGWPSVRVPIFSLESGTMAAVHLAPEPVFMGALKAAGTA